MGRAGYAKLGDVIAAALEPLIRTCQTTTNTRLGTTNPAVLWPTWC